MIKRKILFALIVIFFIVTFMEAYDARSVEDLSYVIAIGIDTVKTDEKDKNIDENKVANIDKEDNILLTIQIATTDSSESGGTSSLKTTLLSVETPSVGIGFSILNMLSTNELNLSHCSAIVISEELASKGINPYFDNLANNIEIRPTASIIISNNTAQEFLEATSASDEISAKYYTSLIGSSETTSYIGECQLSDFYASLHDNTKEPTAIYGFTDGKNIEDLGIAVFFEDKYVGRLTGLDTICHNILTNNSDSATISLTSPFDKNNVLDAKISQNKNTHISVSYDNNSKIPYIDCEVYLDVKILSAAKHYNFTDKHDLSMLETAISEKIKEYCYSYLNKLSKDYNSDIVGFHGYLKRNYLTEMDLKDINWLDVFKNSNFNVKVYVDISSNYLFPRM